MITDTHIQVRASHQSTRVAHLTVKLHEGISEIPEATAVTIASWWQSPGQIGHVLAAFTSGREVSREELLSDIARTRNAHGYHTGTMSAEDKLALDMLATFVLNYQRASV